MSEIQEKLLLSDCKEKNSIAYSIIFEIENKLRLIILHKMDEENEKWWDELNGKYINRIGERT